jgi:lactoylglutathione lyase
MRLNDFMIGLGTVEAARRVHGVESTTGNPSMALVIWCEDVDLAWSKLVADGVDLLQLPHDTGNNNRSALVCNPDGNLVEIVSKL